MKHALLLAPLLSCGCLGLTPFFHVDHAEPPPPPIMPVGWLGEAITPGALYEPALCRDYPTAGSIDWALGGTEEGFVMADGRIRIEEVLRDNPEGYLKVRIRLRNRTDQSIAGRCVIVFYDAWGTPLLSERMEPEGVALEPLGAGTVTNGCRLRQAERFRIFFLPPANVPSNPAG
jgi:hypothetical protein